MYDTKKYLGARIQEIRKIQGLKQTELAELVGIDSKHMSKIECGRCYPSFELLDKIALALNKSAADLLETEHLRSRTELMSVIIERLQNCNDEKFKCAYKVLKEIL